MMRQMKFGAIAAAVLLGLAPMAMAHHAGAGDQASAQAASRNGEMQRSQADTPTALSQRMSHYEQRIDRTQRGRQNSMSNEHGASRAGNSPVEITRNMQQYEMQHRRAAKQGQHNDMTSQFGGGQGQMNGSGNLDSGAANK